MAKKGFRKVKYSSPDKKEANRGVQEFNVNKLQLETQMNVSSSKDNDGEEKMNLLSNFKKWMSDGGTQNSDFIEEKQVDAHLNNDLFFQNNSKQPIQAKEESHMELKTTTIAENVEIVGDIKMEGNLEFYGKITGNIESKGDIIMSNAAMIEGRLVGNNLNISSGNINGNLNIDNDAILGNQSKIIGDVHANTLVSSGLIVGNVFVSEKVTLNETSVIEGNIQAKELEVRVGAKIKGQIDIDSK